MEAGIYVFCLSTIECPDFPRSSAGLLDDLTADWPERETAPLETLFLTSSRYEYLFWEMAWTQSSWPV